MPEWPAVAIALGVGAVLAPIVTTWLRRRAVVDVPNVRSSHTAPVPRGGGLAVAFAATAAVVVTEVEPGSTQLAFAAAPLAFGMLGLADDMSPVTARHRLALQVVLGVVAAVLLTDGLTGPAAWQVVFTAGAAVWVVAYVNAFNFMDGINGLAILTAIICGATWWSLGVIDDVDSLRWIGAVLAGASLGLLPWNFPVARVFLGDVGSYFIGAWSAAAVVVGLRAGVHPEAVLAPVALFLADTAATLLRRARRGERVMESHRDHAYQRVALRTRSHAPVTIGISSATLLCGGAGVLTADQSWPWRAAALAAVLTVVLAYLGVPDRAARRDVGHHDR